MASNFQVKQYMYMCFGADTVHVVRFPSYKIDQDLRSKNRFYHRCPLAILSVQGVFQPNVKVCFRRITLLLSIFSKPGSEILKLSFVTRTSATAEVTAKDRETRMQ
eukprot:gb/GEZJ01009586.1/.p2 GENE.gb/GEZJ01009586.1/~~gb/GEZJ01009586.1/.p2  ORF type:complete len:106 (+),score=7.49 gb/GEZJ01009586.1/:255-572(+)